MELPTALAQHRAQLLACRACPQVVGPPVTNVAAQAQIYLMGQAPGPKEQQQGAPFVGPAGRTLFRWLATLGVAEDTFRQRVYMGAVIRCFPGKTPGQQGDRKPAPGEITLCRAHLERELALLSPKLVVAVGRMAIETWLPVPRLDDVVGQVFRVQHQSASQNVTVDVLPLPHPSGLNRWIQKDPGKSLLAQALNLLGQQPVWRNTFP